MKSKVLINFMESIFGSYFLRMKEYVYCNANQINFNKLKEYASSLAVTVNHDSQDYLAELTWI